MSAVPRDYLRLERVVGLYGELEDCVRSKGVTRELILSDRDTRWMVSMPLLDITEQVASLSEGFAEENGIPDFKMIKGMRNRLVHAYGDVDYDYIADAVLDDLPALVARCEEILAGRRAGADEGRGG